MMHVSFDILVSFVTYVWISIMFVILNALFKASLAQSARWTMWTTVPLPGVWTTLHVWIWWAPSSASVPHPASQARCKWFVCELEQLLTMLVVQTQIPGVPNGSMLLKNMASKGRETHLSLLCFNTFRCNVTSTPCDGSPCQNGTCKSHGIARYQCTCPDGYTGLQCQTDIGKYIQSLFLW